MKAALSYILAILSLICIATGMRAEDKVVQASNISFSPYQGDKVQIRFSLPRAADVDVYFSQDGGRTFQGPLVWVSGNKNCQKGRNTVIWEAATENGVIDSDEVVFKILAIAHVTPRSGFVCALGGLDLNNASSSSNFKGTNTSFGIMGGYGGMFGGYAKVRSTFGQIPDKAEFSETLASMWLDNDNFAWQTRHLQISAGAFFQLNWNVYIIGGVGYGMRDVFLKDYNSAMVLASDISTHSLAVEAGVVLRLGSLAATTSFSYLAGCPSVDFGIGFFF